MDWDRSLLLALRNLINPTILLDLILMWEATKCMTTSAISTDLSLQAKRKQHVTGLIVRREQLLRRCWRATQCALHTKKTSRRDHSRDLIRFSPDLWVQLWRLNASSIKLSNRKKISLNALMKTGRKHAAKEQGQSIARRHTLRQQLPRIEMLLRFIRNRIGPFRRLQRQPETGSWSSYTICQTQSSNDWAMCWEWTSRAKVMSLVLFHLRRRSPAEWLEVKVRLWRSKTWRNSTRTAKVKIR